MAACNRSFVWERKEDEKEGERLGEREDCWNISKYWSGIKGDVGRGWGRLLTDTDSSLFHCCPNIAGSMTDKYFCV